MPAPAPMRSPCMTHDTSTALLCTLITYTTTLLLLPLCDCVGVSKCMRSNREGCQCRRPASHNAVMRKGVQSAHRRKNLHYFHSCKVVFCRLHTEPYPGIYSGYYPTNNLCKFCRTFIPVPGTSVSSVRHSYPYPQLA